MINYYHSSLDALLYSERIGLEKTLTSNFKNLFDYDPEVIYLNNASTGILPRKSAAEMVKFVQAMALNGELQIDQMFQTQAEFRTQASRLLNVAAEDTTFVKNTTDGLSIALHSVDWLPGDNMIVQEDAFVASLYLAHYCFPKVEKRYLPLLSTDDFYCRLERLIDERTRAVVVDLVHFLSGYRIDLQRLGQITKNSNAYLVVDGIQALGAVQVDLNRTPVDFFAAGGVKWLLGPAGTGLLYVRNQILDELTPFGISWAGAEYEDISRLYPVRPLYPDARRFQPVNENYIGMVGLTASLELLNQLGPAKIEQRILNLTRMALIGLKDLGCEILTPDQDEKRSGIVTFKHPHLESASLHERLLANKVICSLREGWLRFAIHFYSEETELEKVIALIDSLVNQQRHRRKINA